MASITLGEGVRMINSHYLGLHIAMLKSPRLQLNPWSWEAQCLGCGGTKPWPFCGDRCLWVWHAWGWTTNRSMGPWGLCAQCGDTGVCETLSLHSHATRREKVGLLGRTQQGSWPPAMAPIVTSCIVDVGETDGSLSPRTICECVTICRGDLDQLVVEDQRKEHTGLLIRSEGHVFLLYKKDKPKCK